MTDKKITELNLKSATYYGAQLQMNHFTEELAELIQAAAEGDPQHIAEEIADVEVMVEQMEYAQLQEWQLRRGRLSGHTKGGRQ